MHPKAQKLHPHIERVYVRVTSDFDTTGYMQPKSITWNDGRVFKIDSIQDYRPASFFKGNVSYPSNGVYANSSSHTSNNDSSDDRDYAWPEFSGDCYTVVIGDEVRHLFFERTDPRFENRIGRWFVEQTVV